MKPKERKMNREDSYSDQLKDFMESSGVGNYLYDPNHGKANDRFSTWAKITALSNLVIVEKLNELIESVNGVEGEVIDAPEKVEKKKGRPKK